MDSADKAKAACHETSTNNNYQIGHTAHFARIKGSYFQLGVGSVRKIPKALWKGRSEKAGLKVEIIK